MADSSPPCRAEAGTVIEFTAGLYSSDDYSLKFALNNGVASPAVTEATVSGDGFLVTLDAPAVPGSYAWGEVYTRTSDGKTFSGRTGTIEITPSILAQATPSIAATILAKLQTAYSSRAESMRGSVSFNGQSVTWNSPSELRQEITYWEARVIAEKRAAFVQRGGVDPYLIRPRFLPPGC